MAMTVPPKTDAPTVTCTRPSRIMVSTARREATPRAAIHF